MTQMFTDAMRKALREDLLRRAADAAETYDRCPARACVRHRRCAGPFSENVPFCIRWFARPRPVEDDLDDGVDYREQLSRVLDSWSMAIEAEKTGVDPRLAYARPAALSSPPDHTRRDPPWDE